MVNQTDASPLSRLLQVIRVLRDATGNAELQMHTIGLFFYIASRHPNEVSLGEIQRVTGMEQTTVSRNCQYLAKGSDKGHGGYKLIEVFEDVDYRKRKLTRLTTKGQEAASRISALLNKFGTDERKRSAGQPDTLIDVTV